MTCRCGRPLGGQRRCCRACRFAPEPDALAHSRYCRARNGDTWRGRGRRPTDFSRFDPIAVEIVASGTPMRLHVTDTGEAVRRLVLQGKTDKVIGRLIGRSKMTVFRIRKKLDLETPYQYARRK